MTSRAIMIVVLSFVVIAGLANAASALPSPSETLSAPDSELIVQCGFMPEFDPIRTMVGLFPEPPTASAATRNPDSSGAPVPLPDGQDLASIPEPSTLALVCLGLGLLAIRFVKRSLRT